ncbi:hypothetical protein ACFQX6_66105 [Streptosporangium lutulentum]
MPTVESSPEWTDIVTALFALLALLVAIWAAWKASQQADMAADSARFAGTQAEAAKEQVNIALRQLELSEKVRREQQEPYVVVDIQPNSSINKAFDLIIENVGPTVARNVKIAFDPLLSASRSARKAVWSESQNPLYSPKESHLCRLGAA